MEPDTKARRMAARCSFLRAKIRAFASYFWAFPRNSKFLIFAPLEARRFAVSAVWVPFFNAQSQRKGAIAPCSWTPEESQVESCEHQDNANIHCQPFPESVSEEREIYTDYDGCHRHHVKHYSYLSAHFSQHSRMTPCWSG